MIFLLWYAFSMNIYTNKFNAQQKVLVRQFFEDQNAVFSELQYADWKATVSGISAALYTSGKFVLQGKEVSAIAEELESKLGISTIDTNSVKQQTLLSVPKEETFVISEYIGTDESGKGDFFGPLVIAGVYVDIELAKKFKALGIKDSKKLDDTTIMKYAAAIRNSAPHSVVTIMPEKYNQLYSSFKNLNKLLAWGHARAIENVLTKQKCEYALSDKFGDESLIKNALLKNGQKINLEQRVRGESFIAVAAASVIARAEFVKRCREMENKFEMTFHKGASDAVVQDAKLFALKYGKDSLNLVAKMHFKTVNSI